jgi:hypothetical protein
VQPAFTQDLPPIEQRVCHPHTLLNVAVDLEQANRNAAITSPGFTTQAGERALKVAIMLLAELDALQHGDRLTVTEG